MVGEDWIEEKWDMQTIELMTVKIELVIIRIDEMDLSY